MLRICFNRSSLKKNVYVHDPRVSTEALPKGDWEKHIKGINDGKLTITNKPTGLK